MWRCAFCSKLVLPDKDTGKPESKYWNVAHSMVFCGPKCSLDMHELNYVKPQAVSTQSATVP